MVVVAALVETQAMGVLVVVAVEQPVDQRDAVDSEAAVEEIKVLMVLTLVV